MLINETVPVTLAEYQAEVPAVNLILGMQGLLTETLRFIPTGEAELIKRIHAALSIRPNG